MSRILSSKKVVKGFPLSYFFILKSLGRWSIANRYEANSLTINLGWNQLLQAMASIGAKAGCTDPGEAVSQTTPSHVVMILFGAFGA